MHGKKKTSTGPLLLRIALILLCMVAFSTSMLAGLYARYTAKGRGDDTARVAKFDVNVEGISENVTVDASQGETSGTYTFTVKNDSEVAITYDLVITFEKALPAGVSVSLQGETGIPDGNTVTFSDVANLAPASADSTRTLTFTLNLNTFTENASGLSVTETVNFTATIRCTQID